MVYAGANDGMLHGFDASTGASAGIEMIAYVPGTVFAHLHQLAHRTTRTATTSTARRRWATSFFDGTWHTVLVGGLNKGGQGIYALDVTEPGQLQRVQRQQPRPVGVHRRQRRRPRLHVQPAGDREVARTCAATGRWVAVFGNGYNSTATDGAASTTGNAVLYIVDSRPARCIARSIPASATRRPDRRDRDNGLSTPAVVDIDGDRIVDYAYAGDLYGNMWKFDLRNANPANWKVAYGTCAEAPAVHGGRRHRQPQPITARPEVTRGPKGAGMVVLFGTGKYLEDRRQAIVSALRANVLRHFDPNPARPAKRAGRDRTGSPTIRLRTDPDAPALHGVQCAHHTEERSPTAAGWYMDLDIDREGYRGEEQVSNPILRDGESSSRPDSRYGPVRLGGNSWLMELDSSPAGA